jgi:hypothetical protein
MAGKKGMSRRRSTPGTHRAMLWQSMRILRRFSAPGLVRTVEGCGLDNALRYLRRLERHGYVQKIGPSGSGRPGQHQEFALVKNPGPAHPVYCDRCNRPITAKTCKEP